VFFRLHLGNAFVPLEDIPRPDQASFASQAFINCHDSDSISLTMFCDNSDLS